MKTAEFDWCGIASGKVKLNVLLKLTFDTMKAAAPQFFQECPFNGNIKGTFLFDRKFVVVHPNGVFKQTISMTNGSSEIMKTIFDYTLV
jgi:hypothetical protein